MPRQPKFHRLQLPQRGGVRNLAHVRIATNLTKAQPRVHPAGTLRKQVKVVGYQQTVGSMRRELRRWSRTGCKVAQIRWRLQLSRRRREIIEASGVAVRGMYGGKGGE